MSTIIDPPSLFLLCMQVFIENFPVSSSTQIDFLYTIMTRYSIFLSNTSLNSAHELITFFHGPTALIIIFFYRATWMACIRKIKSQIGRICHIVGMVLYADIITTVIVFSLKHNSFGFPVWLGQLITSSLLCSLFYTSRSDHSAPLTYARSTMLGILQGIAILPGISRLAVTYTGARWLGMSPRKAFATAWMVLIPLIGADICVTGIRSFPLYPDILMQPSVLCTYGISCIIGFLGFWASYALAINYAMQYCAFYTIITTVAMYMKAFSLG